MIKIISSLTVISLLVSSCGSTVADKSNEHIEIVDTEEHDHSNEEIVLNNGQKWKVDDSMIVHIRNMEKDVNSFEAKSFDDYVVLAEKIAVNLDLLTSNCTMTGQAHDELHKWLLPFIDLSDEFSASKTEEAAAIYQEIKTSFITFNTYFE